MMMTRRKDSRFLFSHYFNNNSFFSFSSPRRWISLLFLLLVLVTTVITSSHGQQQHHQAEEEEEVEEAVIDPDGNVEITTTTADVSSSDEQHQAEVVEEAVIDPDGNVEITTTTDVTSSDDDDNDDNNGDDNNNDVGGVSSYGVDRSWPIHHHFDMGVYDDYDILDRFMEYQKYIDGCKSQNKLQQEEKINSSCMEYENDRIEMNLLQPKALENHTHAGYAKVYTPSNVQHMLSDLWNTKHQDYAEIELWDPSNTYVNHWSVPTKMLDIKKYLTESQIQQIVSEVQPILEAWTQQSLTLTSIYGIRAYYKGAILAPHVDRLPLVTSCIIHVASSESSSSSEDEDENNNNNPKKRINPWVLEVYGHDGIATNVTMDVGDMVLYESHTIIHGRPYPLESDYYANIFIHFEPIGYTIRHAQKGAYGTHFDNDEQQQHPSPEEAYQQALEKAKQKQQRRQPMNQKEQEIKKEQELQKQKKQEYEMRKEHILVDENFNSDDTNKFMYRDDLFYNTNNPAFAKGERMANVWTGSPGLQVRLGQKGDPPVRGISGGWTYTFTLNAKFTTLKVKFDYQLQVSSTLLHDEYGQCIVSLDSTRQNNVATLVGDNGNNVVTSGTSEVYWHNVKPGQHTISFGAYNNKKTYDDEWVQVQIDNVVITVSQQHSQQQSRTTTTRDGVGSSTAAAPTDQPSLSPFPDLPHYVHPTLGTQWKQQFEYQRNQEISPKPTRQTLGLLTSHLAAADGLLDALKDIAAKDRNQLFKGDANGWRPLHEAARSGHADVVEYLLQEGAQVNERTNQGKGGNALWWAEKKQTKKHKETAVILKKYGAVKLPPKDD